MHVLSWGAGTCDPGLLPSFNGQLGASVLEAGIITRTNPAHGAKGTDDTQHSGPGVAGGRGRGLARLPHNKA
jgi:hypothetical protein